MWRGDDLLPLYAFDFSTVGISEEEDEYIDDFTFASLQGSNHPYYYVDMPPGASTATFTVHAVDDADVDAGESVTLTLVADGFIAAASPADSVTITIEDNDAPDPTDPVVSITAGTVSDGGLGTAVTFSVTAVPAPESPITVTASLTSEGTDGMPVVRLVPTSGDPQATGSVSAATGELTYTIPNALHAAGTITATLDDGTGYRVSTEEGENTTTASADNTLPSFAFAEAPVVNADGSITVQVTTEGSLTDETYSADLSVSATDSEGDYVTGVEDKVTMTTPFTQAMTASSTFPLNFPRADDTVGGTVTLTLDASDDYIVATTSESQHTRTVRPLPTVSITNPGTVSGLEVSFSVTADKTPAEAHHGRRRPLRHHRDCPATPRRWA